MVINPAMGTIDKQKAINIHPNAQNWLKVELFEGYFFISYQFNASSVIETSILIVDPDTLALGEQYVLD